MAISSSERTIESCMAITTCGRLRKSARKKKTQGGRVNTGWAKEDRQKKRIEDMYWNGGLLGL